MENFFAKNLFFYNQHFFFFIQTRSMVPEQVKLLAGLAIIFEKFFFPFFAYPMKYFSYCK